MPINEKFFDKAICAAEMSDSSKQVGAILLKNNKIISIGVNKDKKTHPLQASLAERVGLREKIYLHAEISALVKAKKECDTIVVARVNPQGKLRMAKPCPICEMALKQAGITNIYYSTDDGFLHEIQD